MAKNTNDTKKLQKKGHKFSDKDKLQAVKEVVVDKNGLLATARKYGVSKGSMSAWVRDPRYNELAAPEEVKPVKKGGSSDSPLMGTDEFNEKLSKLANQAIDQLGTVLPYTKDVYKLTTSLKILAEIHEKSNKPIDESNASTITNYIQNVTNNYRNSLD